MVSAGSSAEFKEAFSGDRSLLGDPDYVQTLFDFAKDFAKLALSEDNAAVPACQQLYPDQSTPVAYPWFLSYIPQVGQELQRGAPIQLKYLTRMPCT